MHYVWLGLTALVALLWILNVIDLARGVPKLPALTDVSRLEDADCPAVSIVFAARDEEEKLPGALEKFLALDYPRYEVVAVNDRSADATEQILESTAQKDARVKVVHISSLPAGWLGKPHALLQGVEHSTGEWIVFTDADVHFSRDLLRLCLAMVKRQGWEHMTLLSSVEMFSVGEKIAMTYFGMGFLMGVRPWRTNDPRSTGYTGVGAFQMIRREAYEKMGGHRRLAMEVVDDMKLGKLVKEAGIRSGVAKAWERVRVRWHAGVGNLIRGTTKNFFAVAGFNFWIAFAQIFFTLLLCVFPWVALPFLRGWPFVFAAIAVALMIATEAGVAIEVGVSPIYALTEPIGALIFCWMMARSMMVTLWSGGVTWRGTFYPLEELRRGGV